MTLIGALKPRALGVYKPLAYNGKQQQKQLYSLHNVRAGYVLYRALVINNYQRWANGSQRANCGSTRILVALGSLDLSLPLGTLIV